MGAGSTPAGWYPDVERPGGERYWDGSMWTEQRRNAGGAPTGGALPGQPPTGGPVPPAYGAPPGAGPGQPGPQPAFGSPAGYAPYAAPGSAYPKSSAPAWALGLSISGLVLSVCCVGFLLSVPGAIMGWMSMKAIDRGERDPGQRGVSKAAFIIGLIGILLAVAVIVFIVAVGNFSTWSST